MRESYIMVEKEYNWDEFCDLLFNEPEAAVVGIDNPIRYYDSFKLIDNKLLFFDYTFLKDLNIKIPYGFGVFYLNQKVFDSEIQDEEENTYKLLDTFKLVRRELRIYRLKKI